MKLGERLREVRQQRDQTLVQVAQTIDLSVSYLSDLERGRTQPSLDTLERLAAHYHVTVIDLMQGVDAWGNPTEEGLPEGLQDLLREGLIDANTAQDLSRIELHGQRPKDKLEWYGLYLHLKSVMRPYLGQPDGSTHDG
jgi:XRE family transcriptional regulator, regulator of sulfur utilization